MRAALSSSTGLCVAWASPNVAVGSERKHPKSEYSKRKEMRAARPHETWGGKPLNVTSGQNQSRFKGRENSSTFSCEEQHVYIGRVSIIWGHLWELATTVE